MRTRLREIAVLERALASPRSVYEEPYWRDTAEVWVRGTIERFKAMTDDEWEEWNKVLPIIQEIRNYLYTPMRDASDWWEQEERIELCDLLAMLGAW